jgi:hypothetical protein
MEPPITEYTWGRALAAKQVGIQECTKKGVYSYDPFKAVLRHFAARCSRDEMKARIDASGVLCDAAEYGDYEAALCLLQENANTNIISQQGLTPLHHCVSLELEPSTEDLENKKNLINILCNYNADPGKKDECGRRPADFAREILDSLSSESQPDAVLFLENAISELKGRIRLNNALC